MSQGHWLSISIARQVLELRKAERCLGAWPVSTAAAGAGECNGSGQTPRGWHRIRLGIGAGAPLRSVFVGRRATGQTCSPELMAANPGRDWILTRILWLTGAESGRNRGGDVDTLRRLIYIHGTSDEDRLGEPVSAGCIRMGNADICSLFPKCYPGMPVLISEDSSCSGH
ncbi:hypothetical protein SPISAL_04200 [Spiribacter salinus M19-40]|uniref:L,D-TPase catalytic domain-containing protein n=2 Tax=Spiribacter salinus TaxID=1335746 RepID=R4V4Q8_9GAMM|nr:L,D-transpeptidase [Spiribacter salinus]AGM40934.1 hypothetical protein SPISAL_04200 [Spiribacter salinus M19-40]MDR9414306.1 L,D-transpeptidase [Spiribacter sp.]MBY5268164.1 hypothetical protein [Spiribacter salinus]MDR9455013.1 L,D-transpeptidase [Spiribacter sp.]TQF00289.1 MAG: L,D-transpeptidase [Spiribacter salinus]